jgi:heptaprenyl diphosphate synthase
MDLCAGGPEDLFLNAVEARLLSVLNAHDPILPESGQILNAAARHLCVGGDAKRARPMLTLYFGDALGIAPDRLVDAAVAGELIHSASLMHDDVIDEATMRRGLPSVNVNWSNSIAVLSGNYLLSVAFALLKDGPNQSTSDAVEVISHMTKAAIAEFEIRGRLDVSLDHWRDIAVGKTGALFAWCGQAAARVGANEDAAARFYRCGYHIGAAFQLADDVRDLQDKKGLKDRFSDIKNREPSYPILLALSSPVLKREIETLWAKENFDADEVARVGHLILQSDAVQQTCHAMKAEIDAAMDALGHFALTPGGQNIGFWLKHLYQNAKAGFNL